AVLARPAGGSGLGETIGNEVPLLVGQISCVTHPQLVGVRAEKYKLTLQWQSLLFLNRLLRCRAVNVAVMSITDSRTPDIRELRMSVFFVTTSRGWRSAFAVAILGKGLGPCSVPCRVRQPL